MSLIQALKEDNYRANNLQAIPYDRTKTELFKPGFLGDLYFQLKGSRFHKTRPGNGILDVLFCGMQDLSFDAIVAYLQSRPLSILGVWEGDTFRAAGLHFIVTKTGSGDECSCMAGYSFFREWWGTDEQESLTVLGIAQIFGELNVRTIHGLRYRENEFTARYMARFGFKDIATIPDQMLRRGKLVPGVLSMLSRNDFETNLLQRVLNSTK